MASEKATLGKATERSEHVIRAHEILRDQFGLERFRGGQEQIVETLLDGHSAAAVFPTGGGKSLCYQLPALMLEDLTVVVSPLLALMREQVAELQHKGIAAGRLDSSQTPDEARSVRESIRNGQLKLLFVAPERFFNERFRAFIEGCRISLFAIDEAHCISQWGHSFRPDYLKLAKIARELNAQRTLALTATATPAVIQDIREGFGIHAGNVVQTQFYRPNLKLRFTACTETERDQRLIDRLSTQQCPTLVYVTLQKTAMEVAQMLTDAGINARPYHAGLPDETRKEVQDWFMGADDAIVVATIAFGMGIDKSNIRAIYHYNPSKSVENYAQEVGRAGRDGEPAICETLLVPADRIVLENFAYGDRPADIAVVKFVELLVGQPNEFFISHFSLAHETDIRDGVIRSLLTFLELEGYLEATTTRYESYQFKPRITSQNILEQFEGERRRFAAAVLAMAVKKRIWYELKLTQICERLSCERTRVVKMLDFFEQQNWIEAKVGGISHGYRKLKSISDIEGLAQTLQEYLAGRESSELTRIEELFDLAARQDCQSAGLSEHFGQQLEQPCGHCGVCEGKLCTVETEADQYRLGDSAKTIVRRLAKEKPEILSDSRQQARFLCGLTSPKFRSSRLSREDAFGCCEDVPFELVVNALDEQ